MRYEITIREINEDGKTGETKNITLKDGSLPERALFLYEDTQDQTGLSLTGCDMVDACMMIRHNTAMKKLVAVYMMGEELEKLASRIMGDEEEPEAEMDEGDIADGIGQALSQD